MRRILIAFTVLSCGLAALPAAKRHGRKILHRALCAALRLRSRPASLDHPGRTLVIAPHPDDEALGCGGYILRRRLEALPVDVLYITDGRASHPRHPRLSPGEIATLRHAEAARAMHLLRVEKNALHFLDAPDGTLAQLDPAAATALSARLSEILLRLRPAEILLPCRRDGSSEHEVVFLLVQRALALAALTPRVLEYPVWARWNPLRLIPPLLRSRAVWRVEFSGYAAQKHRAIAAYATQTEPTPPWPQAVLPSGFLSFFFSGEEFFFEA